MGIDAVALLKPKPRTEAAFRREADSLEPLDDGNFMLNTLMSYRGFEADPHEARAYLESAFGRPLAEIHDDERGVLMYPDVWEPRAKTYDAIVEEIEIGGGGLWIPLDDSPPKKKKKPSKESESARQEREEAKAKVMAFIARGTPLNAAETVEFEALASKFMRFKPDTKAWCVLVKRKTKLPSDTLARETNDVAVLPDKSTAIYGVNLEDLDSLAWRLADMQRDWIAEHVDKRGVPAFGPEDFEEIRTAKSYAEALARLGDRVRWVVPKGLDAREEEREKKVRALLDGPKKKKAAKKTVKRSRR